MRIVLTAFAFFFGIVTHAAHIAPWNPGTGAETICAYDVRNWLARRTTADGADAFSYDMVGNLLSASNSVAVESFAYDLRDRLTNAVTRVGTNAWEIAWARDAGGLVTNVSYGAGRAVARTYDLAGRLVAVRDWLGHEWTFAWDAANRPVGGTSPGGKTHSFAYDMAGRLSAWSVSGIAGRTIERDAAGRRTRDTVTAGPMPTATLQRNAENTFDAADRLVSATVAYGGSATPVTETFLYDGNGAMTNATSGGEIMFDATYDAQGRLVSASIRGSGAPAASTAFSYDALGNRVGVGGHIFVPDHADPLKRPLVECDADGNPIRYYIWGPGRLLGFIDADDTLAVAHADEQLTLDKVNVAKDFYGEHLPWWGAGTVATIMDVGTGLVHFPAAIGHLGEGAGTFAGDPSWETAPRLCCDIATVATIGAFTARALPSLNAATERTVNSVSVLKNVGSPGKSRGVRVVDSEQDIVELFNQSTKGAQTLPSGTQTLPSRTYPGVVRKLPDGTIMRLRSHSKSGGSTIDITFRNGELMKVHIK